jgi:3-hydroxybutyryl-CoA dehydrogenase
VTDSSRPVAVIGAGTMGNGIAHVFAQQGSQVVLVDLAQDMLDRAMATIGKNLDRQLKKGGISEDERDAALGRITSTTDQTGLGQASIIIEAVTEQPETKFAIFKSLDAVAADDAILASNTSSISITEIAAQTQRPEAVIGMHFMNPVPIMKLVEVIRGELTSDETVAKTVAMTTALGKTPVEVNDYPGFVSNRVLLPMINEAIFCVMEGVASIESVDSVMKLGMAHPMGPLTLADLIGLDVCLNILQVMHTGLGDDKYRPCPLLRRMVAAGSLGRKTGRGFYTYD